MPALLTRIWSEPIFFKVFFTAKVTSLGALTSPTVTQTFCVAFLSSSSSCCKDARELLLLANSITFAPAKMYLRAISLPRPWLAPVIRAVFSFRLCFMFFPFFLLGQWLTYCAFFCWAKGQPTMLVLGPIHFVVGIARFLLFLHVWLVWGESRGIGFFWCLDK